MKFAGKVKIGAGLGTKIGFPTINLDIQGINLEYGVYSCKVFFCGKIKKGALHYGPKPTIDNSGVEIEIYIIDFSGNLYGETVEVEVYNRIRGTRSFGSLDMLGRQITKDVAKIRKIKM